MSALLEKKDLNSHPKADKQQRLLFLKQLAAFEAEGRTLIYLDESGFKSHENRAYGYSHKGCPCLGKYNWQLKNQSNAIGAIHKNKLFAVGLYDCSINSDVFHCWVEELLLTQLPENSVIIMDNASFHKRQDTQQLIADADIIFYGCRHTVRI